MSNTTGLRSHALETVEKRLDPPVIILDILGSRLRLRTVSEEEKLFITRLKNKMCSNQDIRSLREAREFAKPARKIAHQDPLTQLNLLRSTYAWFPTLSEIRTRVPREGPVTVV